MTIRDARAGRSLKVTRVASEVVTFAHDSTRQRITPAKRWELIRKAAYQQAQKRESLGSAPHQDVLEKEPIVDGDYETAFERLLSVDDSVEFADQLRSLLTCYGIAQQQVDELLDKHLERLQWLMAHYREWLPETTELTAQQIQAVKAIAAEVGSALQSLASGRIDFKALSEFAEASMQSLEAVLTVRQEPACLAD